MGFFKKIGDKLDGAVDAAAEKVSELKDTASEKLERLSADDKIYAFKCGDYYIRGTQDEIFARLIELDLVREISL